MTNLLIVLATYGVPFALAATLYALEALFRK
jgi:hypothetical protein